MTSLGASGKALGSSGKAILADLGAILADLGAILVDLGAILVDLGAILADLGAILADLGAILADRLTVRPTVRPNLYILTPDQPLQRPHIIYIYIYIYLSISCPGRLRVDPNLRKPFGLKCPKTPSKPDSERNLAPPSRPPNGTRRLQAALQVQLGPPNWRPSATGAPRGPPSWPPSAT